MAEGCSIPDALGVSLSQDELSRLRFPNFERILAWAESSDNPTPHRAKMTAEHLNCFRALAESLQLSPSLLELAIIDDDILQLYFDPPESRVKASFISPPTFVSVVIGYPSHTDSLHSSELTGQERRVQAWHRATTRIVNDCKSAIVGEWETYSYAYLWDSIPVETPRDRESTASIEPRIFQVIDDLDSNSCLAVGLPRSFSFGDETIEQVRRRKGNPDRPREVTRALVQEFAAELGASTPANGKTQVSQQGVLLIVPFTRPYMFDPRHPGMSGQLNLGERPGGALFLLCDRSQIADTELSHCLSTLARGCSWFLVRSAMLEAQSARYACRQEDVSQFTHMMSNPLIDVSHNLNLARDAADALRPVDTTLTERLRSAQATTTRLISIGELAKKVVLLRAGQEVPFSFDTPLSLSAFRHLLETTINEALSNAKRSIELQRQDYYSRIADISSTVDWKRSAEGFETALFYVDRDYLSMMVGELIKNAVRYGGFEGTSKLIRCTVSAEAEANAPTDILLSVANPIKDARARAKLENISGKKRLYLGLTQLDLLATAFGVKRPGMTHTPDIPGDLVMTCVVATVNSDTQ